MGHVHRPEGVREPRMNRAGKHEVKKTRLSDVPKPLKHRGVNDRGLHRTGGNVLVDRIAKHEYPSERSRVPASRRWPRRPRLTLGATSSWPGDGRHGGNRIALALGCSPSSHLNPLEFDRARYQTFASRDR